MHVEMALWNILGEVHYLNTMQCMARAWQELLKCGYKALQRNASVDFHATVVERVSIFYVIA
jgi:hypothetical protein